MQPARGRFARFDLDQILYHYYIIILYYYYILYQKLYHSYDIIAFLLDRNSSEYFTFLAFFAVYLGCQRK